MSWRPAAKTRRLGPEATGINRSRQSTMPGFLLCIAIGSFGVFTIFDSYMGWGSVSQQRDWMLPAARFLVHPLFFAAWFLLRLRSGRTGIVLPDSPGVAAIALSLWFLFGAAVAEDPIASLGRAVPLLFMICAAFCVVGPSLASPRGTALLFRSAFIVSLLLSSSAVAGAFVGNHPMWGLWRDRFYGPLNATILGPICVGGLLAALAVWKVAATKVSHVLIGAGSLWLFIILVLSRARGSYVFMLVSATVYFALVARRTLAIRVCGVALVTVMALATAWNWWVLDASRSRVAAFLRLDQRDMLAQRSDLWEANASFWIDRPVFGVGLGNEATMSEAATRSHSAYLSTLNEGGVPALALLLIAVICVALRAGRTARYHPRPELRLLGVLTLAIVIGTAALGTVETTLINAASTSNSLFWMAAGAATAASRQVPLSRNAWRSRRGRSFYAAQVAARVA